MKIGSWLHAGVGFVAMSLTALTPALAEVVHSHAIGFGEVPAVLSPAHAEFHAVISRDGKEIRYTLKYSGIATEVTQAHVHFGKARTNGGIMVFACSNLASAPAGTQPCPKQEGTVTGTWTSANVQAVTAQGIAAGEDAIAQVIEAIRNDAAYFNLHSIQFPGGEVRDQVR